MFDVYLYQILFSFIIYNTFSILDRDIARAKSHLIRFARVSNHVADFNTGNTISNAKSIK